MNKKLIFLAILLMVCSITAFAGGKKDSGGNPFMGTLDGTDVDGQDVRMIITASTWTLTASDYDLNQTGTYTYSGNVATFRMNGETVGMGTLSDGILTVSGSDSGMPYTPYTLVTPSANPFFGTWTGTDADGDNVRIFITASSWTMTSVIGAATYTYSGNTATISIDGKIVGTGTLSGGVLTVSGSGIPYSPYTLTK